VFAASQSRRDVTAAAAQLVPARDDELASGLEGNRFSAVVIASLAEIRHDGATACEAGIERAVGKETRDRKVVVVAATRRAPHGDQSSIGLDRQRAQKTAAAVAEGRKHLAAEAERGVDLAVGVVARKRELGVDDAVDEACTNAGDDELAIGLHRQRIGLLAGEVHAAQVARGLASDTERGVEGPIRVEANEREAAAAGKGSLGQDHDHSVRLNHHALRKAGRDQELSA
jgi:hypothetical protein